MEGVGEYAFSKCKECSRSHTMNQIQQGQKCLNIYIVFGIKIFIPTSYGIDVSFEYIAHRNDALTCINFEEFL